MGFEVLMVHIHMVNVLVLLDEGFMVRRETDLHIGACPKPFRSQTLRGS